MVAGFIAQVVEQFLPVADNCRRVSAPSGRDDAIMLPRVQGGLADAGDDFLLGPVLIRAVVDLAEEEVGEEFWRGGLRREDGRGGFARALQRAGAGGGERGSGKVAGEGLSLCSPGG